MIGYVIEQELGNLLPLEVPLATILTMIEVDPDDPAFGNPTKFVGPCMTRHRRIKSSSRRAGSSSPTARTGVGWSVAGAQAHLRDPSHPMAPRTRCRGDLRGGGGVPTMYDRVPAGPLVGVEAVIDKDSAGELLAREVGADLFVMATDVDGVYRDWGTPEQRPIDMRRRQSCARRLSRRARWGPRSRRRRRFVEHTGKRAAIGEPRRHRDIVDGTAGTQVVADSSAGLRGNHETFGVHSEVGTLRKVMVHRPELSLRG
jgi:carbamate kinase